MTVSSADRRSASAPRMARYYRGARTVHLERLRDMAPGDFFYAKPMYDFTLDGLESSGRVEQLEFPQFLRLVWAGQYDIVETAEPYTPSALPQNLALATVLRAARVLRRPAPLWVTYAIENADLPTKFARQFHLPRGFVRLLLRLFVGYCFGTLTRVAFGTQSARENYARLLGDLGSKSGDSPQTVVIPGLPTSRARTTSTDANSHHTIFLGAFDDRKGLTQLLDAWPGVLARIPGARLTVMGKGPREFDVVDRCRELDAVTVLIDPPRGRIWDVLASGTALVLLSQPSPGWREQIGLPILEGLSVGLEIVSSSETGIADWLEAHGHTVLNPAIGAQDLAEAIAHVLVRARPRAEIVAALPARDGRLEADDWLARGEE